MIKKADWEAAADEVTSRARQRLGDPPSDEDLLAFSRGQLSDEDAARVRDALVAYPDLARALVEPVFAPQPAQPGDPDHLTDDEVERDWKAIQGRLREMPAPALPRAVGDRSLLAPGARPRVHLGRNWPTAIAAVLAVAFCGLWLWSQSVVGRLQRESREPRINLEHRLLLPDGQRGGATPDQPRILLSPEANLLLSPALIDHPRFPLYRLDVVKVRGDQEEIVWSAEGLERREDDTFEILVPIGFFGPGEYRLEIYGVADGGSVHLTTYTVERAED